MQLVKNLAVDVKNCDAGNSHEEFVRAANQDIDLRRCDVDRLNTYTLNSINHAEDAAITAELAQRLQIDLEAVVHLHVTYRDRAGSGRRAREEHVHIDKSGRHPRGSYLDTAPGQVQPRVANSMEIAIWNNHIVARPPINAICNRCNPVAGGWHKTNIAWMTPE
jgi:hypothetical protein